MMDGRVILNLKLVFARGTRDAVTDVCNGSILSLIADVKLLKNCRIILMCFIHTFLFIILFRT